MPTVICPHCQFFGNIPAGMVNQSIRCRQCSKVFSATPIQSQSAATSPAGQAAAPSFEFDAPNGSAAPVAAGKEPWYYGYCHIATVVLLVLDLASVVVGLAAWVLIGFLAVADARDVGQALAAYVMSSLFLVLWAGVFIVATLYWFAFVLIFIDAARHVRRIHAELARR